MQLTLPRMDYRATSKLKPGSVIEYEVEHAILKTVRAVAMILQVDWAPSNARSRVHVLTEQGEIRVVDMCCVCQIYVY